MAFGLFNKFDRNVSKLYLGIKPQIATIMLPEGKEQLKNILVSLDKLIGGNKPLIELMLIYINTYSRIVTEMSLENMPGSLINKHPGTITQENVYMVISYVMINMNNPAFAIRKDEDIAIITSMEEFQRGSTQFRKTNTKLQKTQSITDQFGIIPQEPIYTNNVKGTNKYLNQLRTERGEKLKSDRKMSLGIKGIDGMVDQYDLFLPSGEFYKTIYINMYSEENSTQAPKGFILIPVSNL